MINLNKTIIDVCKSSVATSLSYVKCFCIVNVISRNWTLEIMRSINFIPTNFPPPTSLLFMILLLTFDY